MCDERFQVDSTFGDPLHGEWKRAFEIGMNAGGDHKILEQCGSEFHPINRMGWDAKIQNLAERPREFNCVVQGLGLMADGFDYDLG